jgi:LAGLIDADG-like domain
VVDRTTRIVAQLDIDAAVALTVAERAYIAGYFDGEGSVGLYPKKSGFALKVAIAQRKPEVLLWLHSIFGGAFVTIERIDRGDKYYELRLEGRALAMPLLKTIAPYVREKKEQVDLVIDHYTNIVDKTLEDKNNVVSLLKELKRA